MIRTRALLIFLASAMLVIAGCGGGGGGNGGTISVTLSPLNPVLTTGQILTFTATVTGTSDTSVSWTATVGTITSNGVYTAPSTTGSYEVTAVSNADPTKSASTIVSVTSNTSGIAVTIQPEYAFIEPGESVSFIATVTGTTNQEVTWSATGNGTITAAGVYTAPATEGVYTITATSKADTSKKASVQVYVEKRDLPPPPPTIY